MKEIDAKGLSCPVPVLNTKNAIETEEISQIKVRIDNEAAQQNVKRFLESQGFQTESIMDQDDFLVVGMRNMNTQPFSVDRSKRQSNMSKILIFCSTDRLGYGDDELGQKLIKSFIGTLNEMGTDLWRIVFVNNGVKLTVNGSLVLDELKAYEKQGVSVFVCGTCLNHFDLLDQKQVGETTNMLDIVTSMQLADKVITI